MSLAGLRMTEMEGCFNRPCYCCSFTERYSKLLLPPLLLLLLAAFIPLPSLPVMIPICLLARVVCLKMAGPCGRNRRLSQRYGAEGCRRHTLVANMQMSPSSGWVVGLGRSAAAGMICSLAQIHDAHYAITQPFYLTTERVHCDVCAFLFCVGFITRAHPVVSISQPVECGARAV